MSLKDQFVNSFKNLKNLKVTTITAMFIAIAVVLGFVSSIQINEFIRIGFSTIPNEFVGLMFGPVVGVIMGGIADVLKFLVKPTGAFFPGWTFNAMLSSLIYGVAFYHKKFTFVRVLVANIIIALVVNLLFGTLWLSIMYGDGFFTLLPLRAFKQLFSVPIDSVVFYLIAKVLLKIKTVRKICKNS